jgi:hypothetical protein
LAELARLIGQTDPNAFAHAQQRPAATHAAEDHYQPQPQPQHEEQQYDQEATEPAPPSWMRNAAGANWQQPAAPTMPPVAHEQQYYQQEEPEQQYSDTPAFLRTARQHDTSRYDDVLYDQNSQNHPHYASGHGQYQDDYQDQQDPNAYQPFYADEVQEEPARKRGGLMTVVAVLALAFVGTAAAYGYRSLTGAPRSGEPPVIKAEQGSTKIVPPTQTSDASGKIVDRISGTAGGPERVLSREEQPIDLNARNGAPRVVFPPLNQSGNPPAAAPVMSAPPQQVANGALSDEPKRVRTTTIRTDQPDAVPSGTAPPPSRPAASARAQATGPVQLSPQANAAPAPAPVRSGGFVVQVSSQRSEADAQASFRALQSKFPNVLGSRSASIRRADLGERGIYYRAMIGPFAGQDEAGQLCDSLKSAGGACVVQRN